MISNDKANRVSSHLAELSALINAALDTESRLHVDSILWGMSAVAEKAKALIDESPVVVGDATPESPDERGHYLHLRPAQQ